VINFFWWNSIKNVGLQIVVVVIYVKIDTAKITRLLGHSSKRAKISLNEIAQKDRGVANFRVGKLYKYWHSQ
jgi:hypothetical protein